MATIFDTVTKVFRWIDDMYRLPQVQDPNRVQIEFVMQSQRLDHWCWAAVASSVSYHLDEFSPMTQKEIAAVAFDFDIDEDLDDAWDRDHRVDTALNIVRCLRSTRSLPVGFREVLRQLEQDRPVVAQIDWGDNTAHAIAITGCWIDGNGVSYLRADDPLGAFDAKPMKAIMEDYGEVGGKWCLSFFVAAP
ncbi:papain-like cysteine protease family protein [Rhizobium ruizarguesonis]|uniref:papain-like cysteine protease family protein n=1 Tax=Rhizobium ruizarguesonis TaxID=2081791 RepID=UPI00102FB9AE|nr:papain-like cysteine protease family protein [Rhizobium ruizarguesonis]TBA63765.1 hypothetical protein ELH57_08720 [Rhizobium ruizarguesonis]TBY90635.1 hypothetical protein E0H40_13825 [Rhizobium leguminosarum bv. viciae]